MKQVSASILLDTENDVTKTKRGIVKTWSVFEVHRNVYQNENDK